jgi:hypothetical protein
MAVVALTLALLSGGCLAAIQLRHTKGIPLLERAVREELSESLGPVDKRLAIAAAGSALAAAALGVLSQF